MHTASTDDRTAPAAASDQRFAFGANWRRFLSHVDDDRIEVARSVLIDMLGRDRFDGLTFLDIGCGSGLMSLAARRLGARVHSLDYDQESVMCTEEMKRRYRPDDGEWTIERGDALDKTYLTGLGQFDIVYSWGVLHHTGAMWRALDNVCSCVAPSGALFIAIYHDAGRTSRRWLQLKRRYVHGSWAIRQLLLGIAFVEFWGLTVVRDTIRHVNPLHTWQEKRERGMSSWHDLVDWVGGYPYECARPEQIFDFYRQRGFNLVRLLTVCGIACNQFVFRKTAP